MQKPGIVLSLSLSLQYQSSLINWKTGTSAKAARKLRVNYCKAKEPELEPYQKIRERAKTGRNCLGLLNDRKYLPKKAKGLQILEHGQDRTLVQAQSAILPK